jgi:uncharacterized membrane protein YfcA
MELLSLLIIFVAGIIGGSYGTLVGGTSIITIPVLIFLGLPSHTAIGTDRLGVTGLAITGWYKFHEKRLIDYRIALIMGIPALIGSFLGANLVLEIPVALLKKIIAVVTVVILILVITQPKLGVEKREHIIKKHAYGTSILISLGIGIYGGFYGAMAATFLLYVLLFTATLKPSSFMMTTTAATVFASKGAINYPMAGAMFLGCAIGSYFGAHYSDRIGNVWIKRVFILIVLIMAIKLLIP